MLSLTFCEGLDRSKFTAMRKLFLFILFCSLYTVGYAQINAYDRSSYSKLSLPSFDEMVKVAQNKQQQYDQNAQYIDVLIDWILILNSKQMMQISILQWMLVITLSKVFTTKIYP